MARFIVEGIGAFVCFGLGYACRGWIHAKIAGLGTEAKNVGAGISKHF